MRAPDGFRGAFRVDDVARAAYSEGAGIARIVPAAVAVPADADDVVAIVRWAAVTGTALVPRGSGSGMAAGATGEGVVVDLSRLDAIGEVDVQRRRIVVGPGAVRATVDRRARERGLRFPVDPSSGAYCTVGGMAGTNAAGPHTLRAGAMRSWVVGIDCVFADGSRAWVRRGSALPDVRPIRRFEREARGELIARGAAARRPGLRKDSSGYAVAEYARTGELLDLLVGSEGTLALFVALELALEPAPGATASLLAWFGTLEDAATAAAVATARGASACELLDRTFLDVAARGGGAPVPAGFEAALLIEVEADDPHAARAAAETLREAIGSAGARDVSLAASPDDEHRLWSLRHAASPTLARLSPELRSMQFIEDGAVPPERLPDYVRGVRASLERHGVPGVIFGHAGDGHVHVNPLVDVRVPDWRERIERILGDVTALVASLGGTLAGEHGDGRLRTPLLAATWSAEALALFAIVKRALDPDGTLNPGVKVALPGQTPIGAIKYDPALPPLPASAREVLDRIERERPLYSAHRLSLLERDDLPD